MHDATNTARYSAAFLRLQDQFLNLPKPCGLDEIVRFNLLYSHLYPNLSPQEKRHAEDFVDALIEQVQDEALAARLSVVV